MVTVNVTTLLATLLWTEFEARHWYSLLFIAVVAPVMVSVPVADPLYGAVSLRLVHVLPPFVLICHFSTGVGVPLTVAVKLALPPGVTV